MKFKCVSKQDHKDESFTVGKTYDLASDHMRDDSKYIVSKYYIVVGDDNCTWSIDKETLEFAAGSEYGVFEIVPDTPKDSLEEPTVSLEQIAQWCKRLNVDINITSEGTYNVFNGDTDQQCEVGNTEHLTHLLQIMVSHKETMEEYEWM